MGFTIEREIEFGDEGREIMSVLRDTFVEAPFEIRVGLDTRVIMSREEAERLLTALDILLTEGTEDEPEVEEEKVTALPSTDQGSTNVVVVESPDLVTIEQSDGSGRTVLYVEELTFLLEALTRIAMERGLIAKFEATERPEIPESMNWAVRDPDDGFIYALFWTHEAAEEYRSSRCREGQIVPVGDL